MTFIILILLSFVTYTNLSSTISPKFNLSKFEKCAACLNGIKNQTPCSQQIFGQNESCKEHEGTRINFEVKIYQTQMSEIVNQSERLYRKKMITWFFDLARSLRMFSWYSFQEKVRSLHMWSKTKLK